MRVYVTNDVGFSGSQVDFLKIMRILMDMTPPVVGRANAEYALRIANGSACIFRINIGEEPRLIEGSPLKQIDRGSLKIGFVDINDENIEDNIRSVIQEFWCIISEDANAECSVVYSPVGKVANFG